MVKSARCTVTAPYSWGGLDGGISSRHKQVLLKENKMLPSLDSAPEPCQAQSSSIVGFYLSPLLLLALFSVLSLTAVTVFLLSLKLEVSRVSKRKMFTLFQQLCAKNNRQDLLSFSAYSDAKEAATAYQAAKQGFFSTLEELGYGSWIRKPQEEDNFSVLDA